MLKKSTLTLFVSALGLALLTTSQGLADGDAEAGKKVFDKCKACHILTGNAKKLGPSLECIYGRQAGTVEGFKYSKAMAASDVVWNKETMAEFLKKPRDMFKGTKMSFAGINDDQQIADIQAYMKEASTGPNCPD